MVRTGTPQPDTLLKITRLAATGPVLPTTAQQGVRKMASSGRGRLGTHPLIVLLTVHATVYIAFSNDQRATIGWIYTTVS